MENDIPKWKKIGREYSSNYLHLEDKKTFYEVKLILELYENYDYFFFNAVSQV